MKELHAKATEKANEIDQRIDLTEEEKDLAHTVIVANYEAGEEAINNATTAEEVAEAKQAGLDSLDQITIDGDSKQVAKDLIDSVSDENLNPKRKKELKDEIDRAESTDQIDEVIGRAEAEAEANALESEKKAAKDEISNLPLSTELVKDLKEQIDQAENSDKISSILESVEERALTEFKQDAQGAIDNVDNSELSPERKQAYKDAVKKADSVEEITDILDEANKESLRNYQALGKDLVDKVDDANLSPEQKGALKAEIDQAATTEAVDEIIGKAETEATDNLLRRQKEEAKNGDSSIDSLTDLSEETRNNLKDQIDAAENEEEILEILAKAGNRNELNKEVKEAIDGIPELTDDQRDKYKKEVEEATSDDEVESVLSELENQAYENYKGEAKDNIDALPGLTNDQKATLKGEVDEATSPAEVGTVLDKAEEQAFNNELAVAKEGALADIADLDFHTPSEKDELEAKVNAAQNPDDFAKVDEAISEAIEENDRRHQRAEERGLGYPQTIHVAPDNKKRSDSTDIPTLPADIVKEDGDTFHFGENLPEGFEVNPNPSWHGVEEIVFKGNDKSEEILFRLNKQNGKVEVHAGENASYDRPNEKLPVKYVGADGTVKGFDRVSALIRPASPTDDSDQTPPVEDSGSTDAGTEQGTGDQTPGQGDTGSTGDSTEDSSPDDGATDEGTTTDQDGAGSSDAGSGQGTGDQGDAGSTEDGSTSTGEDSGTTEETDPATDDESFNPTAVDKPIIIEGSDVNGSNISNEEHDKIKKGVQNAPENAPIEIVSDVQVGEDGIARVDVEVTDPTGTSKPKIISVPVKQNELIKQINQGLGDLATHEKDKKPKPINKETVTGADQEKFSKYNETLNQKKDKIQKLLNDDANAEEGKKKLSEEKRKELQDELDKYKPVKTPKTEIQLARILLGEGKKHNVQDLRDRAVHLLVGVDKNGKQYGSGNGHGLIRYNTINFGDGDDTFELYNGMGIGSTVNLGNGNNEFVIHGKVSGYTTFINDKDSRSVVNGGDGIDTVTLTNTANQQRIWDVNVPKFDRVNLNGSGGQFNVKYQNIVDKQLGGNGPLIVSGVAGKNNSVDFNYGTTSIENKPGSTFDADGTWVAVKKVKKDGKTYVVWRNKKDSNIKPQHEVWVEDTLNVRY